MEVDYINNVTAVEFNKAAYCHTWTIPGLQQPMPIKFKTGTTVFYPTNPTSSYGKKMAMDHSSSSQHLRSSAPEFKPKSISADELNIKEESDEMFQNMSQLEQDLIKQLSYLITENEQLKSEKAIWISEREDREVKMQWLRNIIDKYKEKECVLIKENKDLLAKIAKLTQNKCDELEWVQPSKSLCDSKPEKSFVPVVTIKSSEKDQHNDLLCTLRTEKLEAEKLGLISERENMEIKIQWLRNIIAKYKEKESVVKKENGDLLAEMEKLKQENAMLEKRDELLRDQSAINLCEQSRAREFKSTVMVAQSSEKDNHNDSNCTSKNMLKNRGIKIVSDSSQLDNANKLVEDLRDTTIITNHINDELNTSFQSSIMSSIKLGDDAPPMFTSSMLNESFDSQCCQNLKKQNEILKQIVKSQKERRQEREIRIKDLNATLKSLKSDT